MKRFLTLMQTSVSAKATAAASQAKGPNLFTRSTCRRANTVSALVIHVSVLMVQRISFVASFARWFTFEGQDLTLL